MARERSEWRALAAKIARDLFTNGNGQRVARLVLEPEDTHIDGGLGGWSEVAVAHRIESILTAPDRSQPK